MAAKTKKKIEKAPVDIAAVAPYPSESHGVAVKAASIRSALQLLDAGHCHDADVIFFDMFEKFFHLRHEMTNRVTRTSGLRWTVAAGDGKTGRDIEIADFVKNVLNSIRNFQPALTGLLWQGIGAGAALAEIGWSVDAGRVVIGKLDVKELRWQTYCDWSAPSQLLDFPRWITKENSRGEELPRNRFVYFTPSAYWGHPVRMGLYRPLAWLHLFTSIALKDWLILLDIYGVPMRVGKYKSGSTEEIRDTLKKAVVGMGVDAAAVISDETTIEILSHTISGTAPHGEALARFESLTSKIITSQTLSGDQQKSSSSLAMAQVHERTVNMITDGDARALEDVINSDIIRPLVDFNFGSQAFYPTFRFDTGEDINVGLELDNAKKLLDLGYRLPQERLEEITGATLEIIGQPQVVATTATNTLALNSAIPVTGRPIDAVMADAEKRLVEKAYKEFYANAAGRIDDSGDGEPLSDSEIRATTLFGSLRSAILTGIVAGQADIAKAIHTGNLQAAANSMAVNAVEISFSPFSVLTPDGARAWWINKMPMPAEDFAALDARATQAAFTVARNEDVAALTRLKGLFTKALTEEKSSLLTFNGWYKAAQSTGVEFIDRVHAETVFRTNLATAYEAQRCAAFTSHDAQIFTYLTVVAAGDEATCPTCGALNGTTLPKNDPYWTTHWSPFHHKCRCTIVGLTKYDNPTIRPVPQGIAPADGFGNPMRAFKAIYDSSGNF